MHRFEARISWRRDGAKFTDHRYSRGHEWTFDGGATVRASSSPLTVKLPYSVAEAVDPEEALVAATGAFGCAYITSEACFAVGAHAALDCFGKHGAGCDAVLLACFGDPGLFALKEVARVPVLDSVLVGARRIAALAGEA